MAEPAETGQGVQGESRAALPTGTLQIPRPPELELRSLDITITPQEVRGRYVFHNRSNRDIAVRAAFAAPDLDAAAPGFGYMAIPLPEQLNFMGVSASVDNAPVTLMGEHHIFGSGLQQTHLLEDSGAPLQPASVVAWEALGKMGQQTLQDLRAAGLVDMDQAGERLTPRPRWMLKTTWFWPQVFPAGKDVTVAWRHAASASSAAAPLPPPLPLQQGNAGAETTNLRHNCASVTAAVSDAAQIARKNGAGNDWLLERTLRQHVSTGPAVGGPAGVVTITIEAGADGALAATCAAGFQKAGPGLLRLRRENVAMDENLDVLFVSAGKVASQETPPPDEADAAPE